MRAQRALRMQQGRDPSRVAPLLRVRVVLVRAPTSPHVGAPTPFRVAGSIKWTRGFPAFCRGRACITHRASARFPSRTRAWPTSTHLC